jgi:integrase
MRHTFASRLGVEGVDIRTIQELGRWKDIRMVQRYANLSERHKAEAIEKLSNSTKNSTPADFGKPVSLGSATGIRTLV